MAKHHLHLCSIFLLIHLTSSLKILHLIQPYLIQEQSSTSNRYENDDLPVYRDLPPIRRETKDLSEALEATRNLKFTRPPLDTKSFFANLKKAAEEVQSVLVRVASPFTDFQLRKSDVADPEEEIGKDEQIVKRSKPSFNVKKSGLVGKDVALSNAASDVDVSVQAPFTDVQLRKSAVESGYGVVPAYEVGEALPPSSDVGVHVQAPFTNVRVQKSALSAGADAHVGVSVDAPFTNVKVQKSALSAGVDAGAHVGVSVEAPFTNVNVRKIPLNGVPVGEPGATYTGGPDGAPDMGVRVEAPFVKVRVDGPAVHKDGPGRHGKRPLRGDGFLTNLPRRTPGRPLDLDINIPGIFNLKLLRDETGRGRLGIGVLPIFSSLVNPHKPSDSYPGPPPS